MSTATVSPAAREIAAKISRAFDQDQQLAIKLNDAQHRLQAANGELWSALHPGALGLLNDEIHHTAIGEGSSVIAGLASDAIRFEHSVQQAESVLLPALQEIHWTIHRAFSEHQRISEDRRDPAADIGELIRQLVAELVAAGWTEEQARDADVQQLAGGEREVVALWSSLTRSRWRS